MESSGRRCAVTGASGYVGSRISEYLASRGWTVLEFVRGSMSPPKQGRIHVPYQLDHPISGAVFQENSIRALIHCAYDFHPLTWNEIQRVNVHGSAALFHAAEDAKVEKIIFLSSVSAFSGCSSLYGKAKLEIEKAAAAVGAFVVRSGLVYGSGASGGMFGNLRRVANKSSAIPLIGSGKYLQYLVHEDDLCELVHRTCLGEINFPPQPVIAASAEGLSIKELLRTMAPRDAKVVFVPIPWRAAWLVLKIAELCGVPIKFRSDSVISLVRQNPHPDFSQIAQMAFPIRRFDITCLDGSSPDAPIFQSASPENRRTKI